MDGKVMNDKTSGAHILAFPYPSQGHINPIFQLCKRLASKGVKTTLALTNFIFKSTRPTSSTVGIDTVSDGYDEGGFGEAASVEAYLKRFEEAGSKTLASLVEKYENSEFPITCIIYDAFMPWALDVAKAHGLIGACFFTQACALNFIYYNAYHGKLTFPVKIPGLPELQLEDMPTFISHGIYPAYFELVLNQFVNLEKADYVFVNSFYKLEAEVEKITTGPSKQVTQPPFAVAPEASEATCVDTSVQSSMRWDFITKLQATSNKKQESSPSSKEVLISKQSAETVVKVAKVHVSKNSCSKVSSSSGNNIKIDADPIIQLLNGTQET